MVVVAMKWLGLILLIAMAAASPQCDVELVFQSPKGPQVVKMTLDTLKAQHPEASVTFNEIEEFEAVTNTQKRWFVTWDAMGAATADSDAVMSYSAGVVNSSTAVSLESPSWYQYHAQLGSCWLSHTPLFECVIRQERNRSELSLTTVMPMRLLVALEVNNATVDQAGPVTDLTCEDIKKSGTESMSANADDRLMLDLTNLNMPSEAQQGAAVIEDGDQLISVEAMGAFRLLFGGTVDFSFTWSAISESTGIEEPIATQNFKYEPLLHKTVLIESTNTKPNHFGLADHLLDCASNADAICGFQQYLLYWTKSGLLKEDQSLGLNWSYNIIVTSTALSSSGAGVLVLTVAALFF